MTVLPGSMDYLYYQGILDHIPYEAYEMPVLGPNGMQDSFKNQIDQIRAAKREITSNINTNVNQNVNMGMNSNMNFNSNMVTNPGMSPATGANSAMGMNQNFAANNYNMSGSEYLDYAKQGAIYNTYGSGDYFVGSNNPTYMNYGVQGGGNNVQPNNTNNSASFIDDIKGAAGQTKDTVLHGSHKKGLIALGLLILTPILIIKGHKKPKAVIPTQQKSSFWSKLNPKNWFKKN